MKIWFLVLSCVFFDVQVKAAGGTLEALKMNVRQEVDGRSYKDERKIKNKLHTGKVVNNREVRVSKQEVQDIVRYRAEFVDLLEGYVQEWNDTEDDQILLRLDQTIEQWLALVESSVTQSEIHRLKVFFQQIKSSAVLCGRSSLKKIFNLLDDYETAQEFKRKKALVRSLSTFCHDHDDDNVILGGLQTQNFAEFRAKLLTLSSEQLAHEGVTILSSLIGDTFNQENEYVIKKIDIVAQCYYERILMRESTVPLLDVLMALLASEEGQHFVNLSSQLALLYNTLMVKVPDSNVAEKCGKQAAKNAKKFAKTSNQLLRMCCDLSKNPACVSSAEDCVIQRKFYRAIEDGALEVFTFLLTNNTWLATQKFGGTTPLHYVATRIFRESSLCLTMADLLIQRGADYTSTLDLHGRSVKEVAKLCNESLFNMLQAHDLQVRSRSASMTPRPSGQRRDDILDVPSEASLHERFFQALIDGSLEEVCTILETQEYVLSELNNDNSTFFHDLLDCFLGASDDQIDDYSEIMMCMLKHDKALIYRALDDSHGRIFRDTVRSFQDSENGREERMYEVLADFERNPTGSSDVKENEQKVEFKGILEQQANSSELHKPLDLQQRLAEGSSGRALELAKKAMQNLDTKIREEEQRLHVLEESMKKTQEQQEKHQDVVLEPLPTDVMLEKPLKEDEMTVSPASHSSEETRKVLERTCVFLENFEKQAQEIQQEMKKKELELSESSRLIQKDLHELKESIRSTSEQSSNPLNKENIKPKGPEERVTQEDTRKLQQSARKRVEPQPAALEALKEEKEQKTQNAQKQVSVSRENAPQLLVPRLLEIDKEKKKESTQPLVPRLQQNVSPPPPSALVQTVHQVPLAVPERKSSVAQVKPSVPPMLVQPTVNTQNEPVHLSPEAAPIARQEIAGDNENNGSATGLKEQGAQWSKGSKILLASLICGSLWALNKYGLSHTAIDKDHSVEKLNGDSSKKSADSQSSEIT